MAKVKKTNPPIVEEKLEEVDVHIIDEPIETPPPKVEEVKPSPQVIIISGAKHTPIEVQKLVGETFEERLLNFVSGKSGYQIINDFLRIELKDSVRLQRVNKGVGVQLQNMVKNGRIKVKDNAHLKLGKFYYLDGNPETQYHSIRNVRIEITVL